MAKFNITGNLSIEDTVAMERHSSNFFSEIAEMAEEVFSSRHHISIIQQYKDGTWTETRTFDDLETFLKYWNTNSEKPTVDEQ